MVLVTKVSELRISHNIHLLIHIIYILTHKCEVLIEEDMKTLYLALILLTLSGMKHQNAI